MDGRLVELAARQVICDSLDTLTLSTTCVRRKHQFGPDACRVGLRFNGARRRVVRAGAWSGSGTHGPPGQMLNRRPCESGVVRMAAASHGCVK